MRLAALCSLGLLVVIFLILALTSGALAQPAQGSYGPCCPLVKGQKAPTAQTSATGTTLTGPRYVCVTKPLSLTVNGARHTVQALEVTGSLLTPARLFTMAGANLEWGGDRHLVLTRGARRVELMLGSHAVTIYDGTDSQMVSWPLCPRLIRGISYAPLRPLAEALGLVVAYDNGAVAITASETGGGPAVAAASCPADRVDAALGLTVVRSPAASAFGVGAGIVEVKPGGMAESFGVQTNDVIIGCDGKPVKCPKDLDDILARLKPTGGTIQTLIVARGQEKVTLQAKAAGQ